jgi:putative transcriptional regulator
MSKAADSIRRGLEQAVAYARGEAKQTDYRVHMPALIDVRPHGIDVPTPQQEVCRETHLRSDQNR